MILETHCDRYCCHKWLRLAELCRNRFELALARFRWLFHCSLLELYHRRIHYSWFSKVGNSSSCYHARVKPACVAAMYVRVQNFRGKKLWLGVGQVKAPPRGFHPFIASFPRPPHVFSRYLKFSFSRGEGRFLSLPAHENCRFTDVANDKKPTKKFSLASTRRNRYTVRSSFFDGCARERERQRQEKKREKGTRLRGISENFIKF